MLNEEYKAILTSSRNNNNEAIKRQKSKGNKSEKIGIFINARFYVTDKEIKYMQKHFIVMS